MRALSLILLGALCVPNSAYADTCSDVFKQCVKRTGSPPACSMEYKTCQANPPGAVNPLTPKESVTEKPVTWALRKTPNPHILDLIIRNPNEFWVKQPNITMTVNCRSGEEELMQVGPSLLVDHIGPSSGSQATAQRSVCIGQGGAVGFKSVSIEGAPTRTDRVLFLEYGAELPVDNSCRNVFPCESSEPSDQQKRVGQINLNATCQALVDYRDNELVAQMDRAFRAEKLAKDLRDLWKDREADTTSPLTAQEVRLADRSIRILDAIAEFISGFTPDAGLLKDAAESSSKFVRTVAVLDESKKLLDQTGLNLKLVSAPDAKSAVDILKDEAGTAAKALNAVIFSKYKHVRTAVNMNISSLETVKKIADAHENDKQWADTVKMLEESMDRVNIEIKKWTDELEQANLDIRLIAEVKDVIDQTCNEQSSLH